MTKGRVRKVLSSETLTGTAVTNVTGQDLGEIKDVMVDLDTGRVAYAVLSFGGFLGLGDKLFAIPWETIKLSQKKEVFYLDVPREKLENAPGFDKDNWPDFADSAFGSTVYSYYGCTVYWE